jgi:hypothetical protein
MTNEFDLWHWIRTPLCNPINGCKSEFPNFIPFPTYDGMVLGIGIIGLSILLFRYYYGRFPFCKEGW